MEPPTDKLKAIYADPAWKKEQRMQAFSRLKKKLWNIVGIEALLIALFFLGFWIKRGGIRDLLMGVVVLFVLLLVVQFLASILGSLCSLVPIKDYQYEERLEGWIPLWSIVIETAVIALVMLSFFLGFL